MKKKHFIIAIVLIVVVAVGLTIFLLGNKNKEKFGGTYPFSVKADSATVEIDLADKNFVCTHSENDGFTLNTEKGKHFTVTASNANGNCELLFTHSKDDREDYKITVVLVSDENLDISLVTATYSAIIEEVEYFTDSKTPLLVKCEDGKVLLTFSGDCLGDWKIDAPDGIITSDCISDNGKAKFELTASQEGKFTVTFTNQTKGFACTIELSSDDIFNLYCEDAVLEETEAESTTFPAADYDEYKKLCEEFDLESMPGDFTFTGAEFDDSGENVYGYGEFDYKGNQLYFEILGDANEDFGYDYDSWDDLGEETIDGEYVSLHLNSAGGYSAEWQDGNSYRVYTDNCTKDEFLEILELLISEVF